MSGSESLLRVEGLCSGYGALQVLFDVSFDVRPGEVVALMGSNGAGKTTALKTITGQLKVLRGTVHLDGDDVSGAPAEVLVRRGWRWCRRDAACCAISPSPRTSSSAPTS